MKVLFWVDRFPTYSETFIRDQIVSLLQQDINVLIYTNDGAFYEPEHKALSGFENYKLKERVVDIDMYFEKNAFKRIINLPRILFKALLRKQVKYYISTLNLEQYGAFGRSLRLLYRVHFLLEHNITIIHAHFGTNGEQASVFKQLGLPIKLFCTFHGYDIRLGVQKGGSIYKKLFRFANGIFCISNYNYRYLLGFGVEESKLIKLPNGIDTSFFKRTKHLVHHEVINLLTVARLVKEKALEIAIHAVVSVVKTQPDLKIKFTIVGDGVLKYELQQLIDDLDVSDYIKLIGSKNSKEVRDLMLVNDIFILSSRVEALPTVLLEAQAAGMVVLATDVGSVKDIVKGGLVVRPNDVETFTKGLLEIFKYRNSWKNMSQKGRAYVCKNHNNDLIVKTLKLHYEQ